MPAGRPDFLRYGTTTRANPKDRERLISDVDAALDRASLHPGFLDAVPEYTEEYY